MNVVELALIKQIIQSPEQTEVKMILTTPFCPYAGSMIQQVKEQVETRRRERGQGHPAGRALGPARRRPRLVVGPSRRVGRDREQRGRHRQGRRRHDRPPVRRPSFKDDPRTEAYGTVDEAVAALGLARVELTDHGPDGPFRPWSCAASASCSSSAPSWRPIQTSADRLRGWRHARVRGDARRRRGRARPMGGGGRDAARVHRPGETRASAALEVARTVLRRAERRIVALRVRRAR